MAQDGEFKRGWPVLAAAAVGVGLGLSPLPFYTIGVMIPPLLGEFGPMGWTAGDILNALAIYTFGAFLASPFIGVLAEKFGARRVALVSIVTFGLAMMALALNTGSKTLYIALWLVLAFAGAGTLPITFTRPVANWFKDNRGIALGIALIATGVFGALAKFGSQYIVSNEAFHFVGGSGWRSAYVLLGLLPIVIALPLSYLSLRDVHDEPASEASIVDLKYPILGISLLGTIGLVWVVINQVVPLIGQNGLRLEYAMAFAFSGLVFIPVLMMFFLDIKKAPPEVVEGQAIALPGMTLPEALKEWRFWLLAICFVPISYAVGAIIPNIERVLTANEFGMDEAVGLATLTGLAVLGGRIIGGYLIDRFWAPGVAFVFLASPAIALVMLAQPGVTPTTAMIAILMIGFGAGVEYDFMAYMVSKYFGMKSYSAIYGAIYGFFALGAGLGPSIMTDIADGRGVHFLGINLGILPGQDWNFTLTSAAVILFVSTVPLLFLGKYRYTDESEGALESGPSSGSTPVSSISEPGQAAPPVDASSQASSEADRRVFDFFVSHSSHNREEALILVSGLEARGAKCWVAPRDIQAGKPYADAIADAVSHTSKNVIALISQHSESSSSVKAELELARRFDQPILPVVLDQHPPSKGMVYYIGTSQWIDYDVASEQTLDALMSTLQAGA